MLQIIQKIKKIKGYNEVKYKIGEKITLNNGKIRIIEDARRNIAREEYDMKVGKKYFQFQQKIKRINKNAYLGRCFLFYKKFLKYLLTFVDTYYNIYVDTEREV